LGRARLAEGKKHQQGKQANTARTRLDDSVHWPIAGANADSAGTV
jgi:hypothetical protein